MYFKQIAKNRYRVQPSKDDSSFLGTVEKQEYESISIATGRHKKKCFWRADGVSRGWKVTTRRMFATREEAGKDLIKDNKKAYHDRPMVWVKKEIRA